MASKANCADRSRDLRCTSKRFIICAVILLLAIHAVMLAYSATRHSPTVLEPAFMAAGLSHWEFGHFELYRVNPPLVRMAAALPVMAAGYKADWTGFHDGAGARPEFGVGADFVKANGDRSIWLFTIARWACIPFSVTGALFCFFWSREFWGHNGAGLISLVLWCFEPNILAHGELITTDCAATSLGVGAGYFFWRWLKNRTWRCAGPAGLLFGLAQLSKLSWLILYALWPVLWLFWLWSERRVQRSDAAQSRSGLFASGLQLTTILLLGLYLTNLAYAFDGSGARLGDFHFVSHMLGGDKPGKPGNRFEHTALASIPVPLPREYVIGLDLQRKDFEDFGQPSYLMGEWKDGGWWYYYLYALAVKTPHGLQIMLLMAIAALFALRRSVVDGGKWRHLLVLLAPPLALLVLVSSHLEFNQHVRYVLPVLGYTFVFVGVTAFWPMMPQFRGERSPMALSCRLLVLASLLATIASTLSVYPHQLAYFNELAGGPVSGSKHLLGSNLDWGQGLLELDRVLAAHSEWGPVAIVSSGSPDALGIRALPERVQEPVSSFAKYSHIAISANTLAGEGQLHGRPQRPLGGHTELLTALRRQQPVHVIDYSITLFETSPLFGQRVRGNSTDVRPQQTDQNVGDAPLLRKPPRGAVVRATQWLVETLPKLKKSDNPIRVCPLTHALRGIELSYANRHASREVQLVFGGK